eukprot:GHRR01006357.1.p1 GENE.GHRR01006357.1~~GHRR01006357.1.p1  ORF type:complete len:659 (+),score=235.53 GHRR01006357.1:217-2193(+)
MTDEFSQAVEIIPHRFYLAFLKRADSPCNSAIAHTNISYCIDNELLYEPFYADFGPLNLGKTYRFCEHTKQLLQEADKHGKKLYLYTGPLPQQKANAAVLVGIFQVLYLNISPDEAYAPLACQAPYMPFRDASCGVPTFNLQPIDCIRGIAKAREVGFIDASNGTWRFDLEEYEHYEQVEHGDLNWIVPGKLVAFSGPAASPNAYVGFRAMVPEDYWEYFRRRGVASIVRLNKKVYERQRFLDGGFQHHELYFPDGSNPSQEILLRFLAIAEATPGCLAIHCKAGLGRTGVLICSYIMKHYGFTAEEVIGYIRICRPGSVIGPQQGFIKDIQHIIWAEGNAYRAQHGPHPPPLVGGIIKAQAVANRPPAATPAKANSSSCGGAQQPIAINLVVDATGGNVGQPVIMAQPTCAANTLVGIVTSADLSLKQLQQHMAQGCNMMVTASSSSTNTPGMVRTPSIGSSRGVRGVAPQRLFSAATSTAAGPLTNGILARPATSQQAITRPSPVAGAYNHGRSASASRERPGSSISKGSRSTAMAFNSTSIASLRATLHTDTIIAAQRDKAQPDAALSQSSEFASSGWRTPLTAGNISSNGRPSSTVARVLAPNGQPRKMPMSAVAALAAPPMVAAASGIKGTALQGPMTPQRSSSSNKLSAYYS